MGLAKKLIVICGPTATGKTALALHLAKRFNSELVNADSRQVYQGFDIVSGKDLPPWATYQKGLSVSFKNHLYPLPTYDIDGARLWLCDVVNIAEEFSLAHYFALAKAVINHIHKRNKLPIVVGGTGLYINSLLQPIKTLDVPPNKILRTQLSSLPLAVLQDKLMKEDLPRWKKMNSSDRSNPRRLIRALEIAEYRKRVGETQGRDLPRYDSLLIGLTAPTSVLNQKIRERVIKRWNGGAVDEVKNFFKNNPASDLPALPLGVGPVKDYLSGKISAPEAQQLWQRAEISYAKRQKTWFIKQAGIHWFEATQDDLFDKVEKLVERWYTGGKRYAR